MPKNETVLDNTASGAVSYTNLDGGTYTFCLRVFDPNDHTAVGQTLKVTIVKEKKLTEQPLFWAAGIAALVLLSVGTAHWIAYAKMKRLRQQRQAYRGIVEQSLRTFANAIDAKDPYTNGHSVRVARYSREITRRMGYSENDQESVYYVALLHDIGKIGIPDSICRAVREKKDIPILMVTALGKDVDKICGLGFGADDYIEKPFSPSVLVARVKAHLAQYQRLKLQLSEKTRRLTVGALTADTEQRLIFKNGVELPLKNKEDARFALRHRVWSGQPDRTASADEPCDL